MRILVTSDSHRMESSLYDIIEFHKEADLVINLGDSESEMDNMELYFPKIKYERVRGNCDFSSNYPDEKIITVNNKKIFFAHGHTYGVKHGYERIIEKAKLEKADICLFGHTHNQYTDYIDGLYIMNPGAVMGDYYGFIDITDKGVFLNPCQL